MKAPPGTFWIGSDHPFDLHEVYLNFSNDLVLERAPGTAEFHITADSRYRLWINGKFLGRGPERSWPTSMAVDVIDVSKALRTGRNQIVFDVYCPGYSHFSYVHKAACGLLAWLEVDGNVVLKSDTGWKVRRDSSWNPSVPRVSIYGSGVEVRDLRDAPDVSPSDTSDWCWARVVQPTEGPIWSKLRARTTPILREREITLDEPWQTRLGSAPEITMEPHLDMRRAFSGSVEAEIPEALAAGTSALWVFDLGSSRACLGGVEITALGGETLSVSYAEKLQGGAPLLSDPETYCRMRPTDRFTLRPGTQQVEGFTMRGGRYLIFRLDVIDMVSPAPRFFARIPAYPLAERPLPDLADPLLNGVARICRNTIVACLHDGFTDSTWRESSQWLGDVVAEAFALQAISDDPRPLGFAIDMAAEGVAADGILPSVLPGDVPAYVVTDYNFSWVELLAAYAAHPAVDDAAEMLKRHWTLLERLLGRFQRDLDQDGLIRSQTGRRLFLDWSEMDRREPNLTYNLRYLHALKLAAGLGDKINRTGPMLVWAAKLEEAVRKVHRSGSVWRESPGGVPAGQLGLAMLILTDIVSGTEAEELADQIVTRSLDLSDKASSDALILASPFMHHYLFQALARLGRHREISEIIRRRWGRWVSEGLATTPENWDISFPDGSACHGFSAHALGWLRLKERR